MVFTKYEILFTKDGSRLGYFPIICRCWISFVIKLGIYFGDFEWFLQILNIHLQKLFSVWGIFPSFANVKYHM
jgi:hypothetical protein